MTRKAVIVTGSRSLRSRHSLESVLRSADPDILIHGAAKGADELAEDWAYRRQEIDVIAMPAIWERDGNAAGPLRNAAMLDVLLRLGSCGYDVAVYAFPAPTSRGTWDMVRRAKGAGVRVEITEVEA